MSIIMDKTYDFYKRVASKNGVPIRIIAGLTLFLFYLAVFGVAGFFTFGPLGEIYGLGIALAIVVLTVLLGDRVFLVAVGAREVDSKNHDIYFALQNLSCVKGLKDVRLYSSHLLPVNVYCLQPIFNNKCIIFSDKIIKNKESEIWRSCLDYALAYLEVGHGRFANLIVYLTAVLLSPCFILIKLKLRVLAVLNFFIFLPLVFLKDYVNEVTLREVFNEDEISKTLRVTYYLERFPRPNTTFITSLADDLSLFKIRDTGLWPSLLGSYANIFNNYVKWHERKN